MQEGRESAHAHSPPRVSPAVRVTALGAVLLGVTTWLIAAAPLGHEPLRHAPLWLVAVVILSFAVVERAVFHVEHHRHSLSVSLSEVPTIYAAVFLDLRVAVAARVFMALAAIVYRRRVPVVKVVLNGGVFALEMTGVSLLTRFVVGEYGTDALLVVTAVCSTVVMSAAGALVIAVAIAQYESGFTSTARNEVPHGTAVCVLTSSVAGLAVSAALVSTVLVPLAILPVVLMWVYVKRQGRTHQALRDVEALHGLAGRFASVVELDDIAHVAVVETADLVRARSVALVLVRSDGLRRVAIGEPIDGLPESADDERWLAPPEIAGCARLGSAWFASVVGDSDVLGHLVADDRVGAGGAFDTADLKRLRTIADQLAATIGRGLLHEQLEFEARHDLLTGLANRATFERSIVGLTRPLGLATELRWADDETSGDDRSRDDRSLDDHDDHDDRDDIAFVVMFDLDRFKEVNDTLGHQAGDRLLVEVSRRLIGRLEPDDLLARFAGDEFALCGRRASVTAARSFVAGCVDEIAHPYAIDGLEIVVNVSAGVAVLTADDDAASVLRRADVAMYHAKTHHVGVEVYSEEIDTRTPVRLSMLADLRSALDRWGIELHFQPQLDLATDIVSGVEVLARWNHPTLGWVPPVDFITLAEEGGLIRSLTDQALERSIEAIATIAAAGHTMSVSVNLSAPDLLDERLYDRVFRPLARHGLDPRKLTLEITEGTLLYDNPRTAATLDRLRDLGVRLSIDDFGTGYSSLGYLRRLPVTELKIDREFVIDLTPGSPNETIVRSTIDLGHNLGLQVVAEGVETDAVLERLHFLGCDTAQGYGICRPVPLDALVTWLGDRTYRPDASVPTFGAWSAAGRPRQSRSALVASARRTSRHLSLSRR